MLASHQHAASDGRHLHLRVLGCIFSGSCFTRSR